MARLTEKEQPKDSPKVSKVTCRVVMLPCFFVDVHGVSAEKINEIKVLLQKKKLPNGDVESKCRYNAPTDRIIFSDSFSLLLKGTAI